MQSMIYHSIVCVIWFFPIGINHLHQLTWFQFVQNLHWRCIPCLVAWCNYHCGCSDDSLVWRKSTLCSSACVHASMSLASLSRWFWLLILWTPSWKPWDWKKWDINLDFMFNVSCYSIPLLAVYCFQMFLAWSFNTKGHLINSLSLKHAWALHSRTLHILGFRII